VPPPRHRREALDERRERELLRKRKRALRPLSPAKYVARGKPAATKWFTWPIDDRQANADGVLRAVQMMRVLAQQVHELRSVYGQVRLAAAWQVNVNTLSKVVNGSGWVDFVTFAHLADCMALQVAVEDRLTGAPVEERVEADA
jgi:hypothetical protein